MPDFGGKPMPDNGIFIELGGSGQDGSRSKGKPWVNIDWHPSADYRCDLGKTPWQISPRDVSANLIIPVRPDTTIHSQIADGIYCSHCLEHLPNPTMILNEMARVGKIGSRVVIRCPHPASHLAMVWDHKHVFSPMLAINMERHFPAMYWHSQERLRLIEIRYTPTEMLQQARRDLPFLDGLSDEIICKYGIAGVSHDCEYIYEVQVNEFFR